MLNKTETHKTAARGKISELHAAALGLARLGCAVFPCQPRGKTPATQHGCKDATTDPVRINSWWKSCPDMNIGIATGAVSGFFVVDIDGDEGEASLRKLEETHGPLPPTVAAITGKGRHCYFRLGEHGPVGNSAGLIGDGIDTRGTAVMSWPRRLCILTDGLTRGPSTPLRNSPMRRTGCTP